ncbi:hypothetical protein GCM10028791_38040 [Echinicola sediminis]
MKRVLLILRIRLVLSFLLFFSITYASAQSVKAHFLNSADPQQDVQQCEATFIENKQIEKLGLFGTKEYFESWIGEAIEERRKSQFLRTQDLEVRTIPVVVHVIHNGEAIGQGANIPLSQIEAQIRTLNEDFRRTNPDAVNTPEEFQPVAADTFIEFVLAKQDPNGLPTSGINRVQGKKSQYSRTDASLISDIAYWDSEDYLNIWVVPLESTTIGFSSFPVANLDGLNFPAPTAQTDGVTVDYQYFGEGGNASNASMGRTTTHEIGHFLGLRHIWGDGDCDVDDFVEDTPNQSSSNSNCRSTPRITCGSRDMIENYMDYTTDQCMNLFTLGQLERMDVVLANSPRRASLVNGRATQSPLLVDNDLALQQIMSPQDYICSTSITPEVLVFNAGSNSINSAEVAILLNGQLLEQKTVNVNLSQGASATISFNPINLPSSNNSFEVRVIAVNGTSDQNEDNNVLTSSPALQANLDIPYTYQAGDFNTVWRVQNDDGGITWRQRQISIDGTQQTLLGVNFYNYESDGSVDYFISPQIDLSNHPNAQLVFEMAHAPYPETGLDDRLLVGVSTDCGNSFDILNAPYDKSGQTLSTVESTTNEFIPTFESEFRTEVVNLADYAGLGNVRIAFIAINGFGNNLFIKNIKINSTEESVYSLKLERVASPSPITDGSQENEVLEVSNTGTLPINHFLVDREVNGSSRPTLIVEDIDLAPDQSILVALPNTLSFGLNEISYSVHSPNFDQNNDGESKLQRFFVQNDEEISVPWRQYFDDVVSINPWVSINPESGTDSWELISKQTGEAGDNLANVRDQSENNSYWIGSPVMDLSGTSRASIFFDRAASGVDSDTRLTVLLSTDGGVHFDQELEVYVGNELNTIPGESPINPNAPEEFKKEFIDLSAFTGEGFEKVRIAFVVENGSSNTNPVYLENIEFFLANNPDPVYPGLGSALLYPNPATDIFNLAFNLDQFEDVQIQIISASGQVVYDVLHPMTLNQTYSFSTSLFSKGVFIIKIQSDTISMTKRLIIP